MWMGFPHPLFERRIFIRMIKDRTKIKAVLSVVALSMALGFNAEYVNKPLVSPVAITDEEKKQCLAINVTGVGNVKKSSLEKVRELFNKYLSDKVKSIPDLPFNITVVEGKEVNQKYSAVKPPAHGICLHLAEGMIDAGIPQIAKTINSYCANA